MFQSATVSLWWSIKAPKIGDVGSEWSRIATAGLALALVVTISGRLSSSASNLQGFSRWPSVLITKSLEFVAAKVRSRSDVDDGHHAIGRVRFVHQT